MDVQKVCLPRNVCDGHELIVTWLEKLEDNQVGVEGGVFVVGYLAYKRNFRRQIHHKTCCLCLPFLKSTIFWGYSYFYPEKCKE